MQYGHECSATLAGHVDLTGADLNRANLALADLSGANLADVKGCDTATHPRPILPGC